MINIEREILVIGAGPAGLCAAAEARRAGVEVLVVDENSRPGGQLFKQIHKFFGSSEHSAGCRGFSIGQELCVAAEGLGVEIMPETVAYGWFKDGVGLVKGSENYLVKCRKLIVATGGSENTVAFPGSTLPGVLCAGAAQTMVNIHRTKPGRRAVILGSGNVGLIVAYQLMQAGIEVAAVAELSDHITGYGVHAAKLRRAGVPIYVSRTVSRAIGAESLEAVELVAVDADGKPVPGSEARIEADLLCLAVGMSPLTELLWQAGAEFDYIPELGGFVPLLSEDMETTNAGVYAAGDVTGIEEAPLAMEEGKLAGLAAAEALGYLSPSGAAERKRDIRDRMEKLNSGSFGEARLEANRRRLREPEKGGDGNA